MARLLPLVLAALACPSIAAAQSLTPDEAVKRMKLPEGFSVRVVASEPMIRQPVSISFDSQGRMWVLQYLQYPNYAGLKPVKQDQYLRTIWDKIPEPPPHGPKGLDRITICSDPDENGVFRKSTDFVTGLNIASGFCLGHGGVYVVQPPYLLFYPDKNEDDVPDGDPEVLLTGFGMNDTHSLANSLQWGPDGWLYGAAGSTSTCEIKNPNHPKDEVVAFQQGIWRFHPKTKKFELFSEGGGNTYGLDFDKHGQVIAGTNYGGKAMLHQMQGAYYVKGFSKHGPLHNPHTYGYFDHVPYTGFQGGHVTCGGIVYQADAYPEKYRDQYIAANLLSNVINWHRLDPDRSSFKSSHGGTLLQGNDPWFRPIDCLIGPDGSVYVVDFYDRRAAHLDPVDNWDKTNGRVYKIEYRGTPKVPPFDLRKKSSADLVQLLKHPNKWWRNEARRLLAERRDKSVHTTLRNWLVFEKGDLALEALWALYVSGGWSEGDFENVRSHENEYVRAWLVRFLGDDGIRLERTFSILDEMARTESSRAVLAQLACTAMRLDPQRTIDVMTEMLVNPVIAGDPQIPLLMWWAMEAANTRDKTDTVRFPYPGSPNEKLRDFFGERVARRFLAGDIQRGDERLGTLIDLTLGSEADIVPVLRGAATALQARPLDAVPNSLKSRLAALRKARPNDLLVLEVLARMNDSAARTALLDLAADTKAKPADRIRAIDLLRQVRDEKAKDFFLAQLTATHPDSLKVGFLNGLEAYDDPAIGTAVLAQYPKWSGAVKKRAMQLLLSRPAWALMLLKEFDGGKFPKTDLTLDYAKSAVALEDKGVTALVEKHFGKLAPETAGEKRARITWVSRELKVGGPGDPAKGKALFAKHCAACHQMHGEGGKVGPDLTTADRKNQNYLLINVIDPSGYIRPEYVVQNVTTFDGRKLSGIVEPGSGESITLVNVVNDQPQKTTIAKADIEDMRPSAVSLMPEKLLETLSYADIGHLFAYLASDSEIPNSKSQIPNKSQIGNRKTEARKTIRNVGAQEKKLKICLVSGSFEYKSDASLAAFKKYVEGKYPVEFTLVSAKSDKDLGFPGLEKLDDCDLAIFFTRRLQIEGEALDHVKNYVKSGKPIIGIRTASHGFQKWLEMDKEVFGGDYQGHFGHDLPCDVAIAPKAKDHPVLRGIKPFQATGGLYKNPKVASDVTVLLIGSIPKSSEPVAWVRDKASRRVFYTSLGHPEDFKNENFLRLLVNAIEWTTKQELKPAK